MTINGVLNINKPAGLTSQDVCARLRRRLHIKRIGHTGTLDPMATGVLPVCAGSATRIIEYYDRDLKSYHAAMKLGVTTDTLDITGEVLEERDHSHVTEDAVRKAFADYTGPVDQIPPKYSALKIDGKRAYDLAREGVEFTLKPRRINIVRNDISFMDLKEGIIEFDVTCSKGTYIRTICDDIGRTLGCGAAMTALTRTGSGFFTLENSYDLESVLGMTDEEIEKAVIPMDETLTHLGKVRLNDNRIIAFSNGNPSDTGFRVTDAGDFYSPEGHQTVRVYGRDIFLGVGHIDNGRLVPDKVISR